MKIYAYRIKRDHSMKIYAYRITNYPKESLFWKPTEIVPESERDSAVGAAMFDGEPHLCFLNPSWTPEGWEAYAQGMWPGYVPNQRDGWSKYKPFFWPSQDKIWKSRSSAAERVHIVEMWGGEAEILEAEVEWVPVEVANLRRRAKALEKRIAFKEKELFAMQDALDELVVSGG